MIETIKNFLPDEQFFHFAREAMEFPHYGPCDFTTSRWESDGSIDTLGENLRTVDVYKQDTMFQAMIFSRNQLSSLATDFYAKEWAFINLMADLLDVKKWWLIRINCTVGQDKSYVGTFHTDTSNTYLNKNMKTAILYLNTNNGFTEFDDDTRVDSIENRLVTFDGSVHHSSSTCTDKKNRLVLAINYF